MRHLLWTFGKWDFPHVTHFRFLGWVLGRFPEIVYPVNVQHCSRVIGIQHISGPNGDGQGHGTYIYIFTLHGVHIHSILSRAAMHASGCPYYRSNIQEPPSTSQCDLKPPPSRPRITRPVSGHPAHRPPRRTNRPRAMHCSMENVQHEAPETRQPRDKGGGGRQNAQPTAR